MVYGELSSPYLDTMSDTFVSRVVLQRRSFVFENELYRRICSNYLKLNNINLSTYILATNGFVVVQTIEDGEHLLSVCPSTWVTGSSVRWPLTRNQQKFNKLIRDLTAMPGND